jgi:hypothetical protein
MNYITSYSYSNLYSPVTSVILPPTLDHRVMLTIALRTIGATGTTQSLGSSGGQSTGGLGLFGQ